MDKKNLYQEKQEEKEVSVVETPEPPKKKNKTKKIIVLIIVILFLLIGILLFFLKRKMAPVPLEEYTFYSAIYKNEPVLFYKYPGMLLGLQPIGPYEGEYIPYTAAMSPMMMNLMMNVQYVDFRKLQNPQKLFTFDRYATIENIKLSSDNSSLMMSIVGGNSDNTNYIYQVNLKTFEGKKVWEHTLRTGISPLNQGFIYVTEFVPDSYVVFDIIQGNPPPDTSPKGTVVVNLKTGTMKSLGAVGAVSISANSISYKKINPQKTPCQKNDPVCFPGDLYRYTYVPSGEVLTQPLP
jgi:hypothetical protein